MPRQISILILLALSFCACTHTLKISQGSPTSDIDKANKKFSNQVAANGSHFGVKQILMTPDSTTWYDFDSGRMKTISNTNISDITIKRRGRGALEASGIGFLTGFPVGFSLAFASYDEDNFNIVTREQGALLAGGFVGLIGALIGTDWYAN